MMLVLNANLCYNEVCYNEVCYKGTALYHLMQMLGCADTVKLV